MDAEEALRFVENLLSQQGQRLNDLQRIVFLGTWHGKSYELIHADCENRCSLDHLKRNVGYELWKTLSDALEEKVLKNTLQGCVHRAWQKWDGSANTQSVTPVPVEPVAPNHTPVNGQSSVAQSLRSPQPEWLDEPPPTESDTWMTLSSVNVQADWRDAPPDKPFYGCHTLLEQLDRAVRVDLCRLISLYGISGIGKTALALQLARQVMDQFEFVIWRSLKQPPALPDLLADLIKHFSGQQETSGDLHRLMQYITNRRCLIILDGFESVLRGGVHDGSYQPGFEQYGELLRHVGSVSHESCLMITGWENPREVLEIEGNPRYVYSEDLKGLGAGEVRELFKSRNCSGSDLHWRELIRKYWGHPLVLNSIALDVQEFCGGDTARFLEEFTRAPIPEHVCCRLDQQFERLSQLEQALVRYLQQQDNPISFPNLQKAFGGQTSDSELRKVLRSLIRRALLKSNAAGYSLQKLTMEYLQLALQ